MRFTTKEVLDYWEFLRILKILGLWIVGLSLLIAGGLFCFPMNTRLEPGTLMYYYFWPSFRQPIRTSFCKVQLDTGAQLTAICSLKARLPNQRLTVEITRTYLFGLQRNSVIEQIAEQGSQPDDVSPEGARVH